MFCNYCGAANPDDAAFCRGCGRARAHRETASAAVRAVTKESGFVDKLAGIYVQNEMIPQEDPGATSCYIAYYTVMFQKDRVRASIADWLEAKANLK
jgi:hypothetical protein